MDPELIWTSFLVVSNYTKIWSLAGLSHKAGNTLEHVWSCTVLYYTANDAVQHPLDITANVCTRGSCVGSEIVVLCRTKQCSFDGPTTIGSGRTAHEHVCSVYLRLYVLSTLACRGDTVRSHSCSSVFSAKHFANWISMLIRKVQLKSRCSFFQNFIKIM